MVDQPIRLVCPECDSVHRVKRITLGKLYRCKKCKAELITMSPAVLRCPSCQHASAPEHIEVSRMQICQACADSPLLEVTFPEAATRPSEPISAPPPAPKADSPAPSAPPPMPPLVDEESSWYEVPSSEWDDLSEKSSSSSRREAVKPSGYDRPSPAQERPGTGGDPESLSTGPAEKDTAAKDAAMPALYGQEDRAVHALRQVFDKMQNPLIEEIERTRASVPWWVMMLVVLVMAGIIALLGTGLHFSLSNAKRAQVQLEEYRKEYAARNRNLKAIQKKHYAEYDQWTQERDKLKAEHTELRVACTKYIRENERLVAENKKLKAKLGQ